MNDSSGAAGASTTPRHPVGTLAIVGVYGLLFVLGWLAFYFLIFRARGAVTP